MRTPLSGLNVGALAGDSGRATVFAEALAGDFDGEFGDDLGDDLDGGLTGFICYIICSYLCMRDAGYSPIYKNSRKKGKNRSISGSHARLLPQWRLPWPKVN